MVLKKTSRKQVTRSPLSLVSSSLASTLRGPMQAASPQEQPWRDEKRIGNRRGRRKN